MPCPYQWFASVYGFDSTKSLREITLGRPTAQYGLHGIDFCGERMPEISVAGTGGVDKKFVAYFYTVLCATG